MYTYIFLSYSQKILTRQIFPNPLTLALFYGIFIYAVKITIDSMYRLVGNFRGSSTFTISQVYFLQLLALMPTMYCTIELISRV